MKRFIDLILTAIRGTDEDLTAISLNRAIVLLAVPMILEMVMESLFAVVDAYFVAQVGVAAVATVGLTEAVLTLIYSIAIGLSAATTALVARRTGEKDSTAAAYAGGQAIMIALLFSIFMGVAGVIWSPDILALMGGEPEQIAEGVGYTRIMFGGNIIIMLIFLLNAIFRGVGNAVIAMRVLWIANGINIVLDPCLILGLGPFPEMGVAGAAVATNIGRGIGVLIQLFVLFNGGSLVKIGLKHLRPSWEIIRRLLKIASSATAQYLVASASWIFLMRAMAVYGLEVVAGYTISIRVIIFAILPVWGMANAAATLVGQNLGAKQPERAEISAWRTAKYASFFLLGLTLIFFFAAPWIIGFFDQTPAVLEAGSTGLRIFVLGNIFFAYGMVLSQALNGAGDTRTPLIINFMAFWLIQIPLAFLVAFYFEWDYIWVFWDILFAESVYAILAILVFRMGKWKSKQV